MKVKSPGGTHTCLFKLAALVWVCFARLTKYHPLSSCLIITKELCKTSYKKDKSKAVRFLTLHIIQLILNTEMMYKHMCLYRNTQCM